MGIRGEFNRKKTKFIQKNERGSVTLFVLIAMIFFLIVGLSIFMANMNNGVSQERDIKKIQSEYSKVDNGKLDQIYEEEESKQTDKLLISVTDKNGEIYKTASWINTNTNNLPLNIAVTWPRGISDNDKKITVIGKINGEDVEFTISKSGISGEKVPANINRIIVSRNNICQITNEVDNCNIKVIATAREQTAEVNIRIDKVEPKINITPNGEILSIDKDKGESKANINAKISATDESGSGLKEIYYQLNTNESLVYDDEWIRGDLEGIDIRKESGIGIYYLHVKVIDEAGNVKTVTSKPYIIREANYRVETPGYEDKYAMTLDEAIEISVENRSKIVAIKNIEEDDEAHITKNIVLDTNGYTVIMEKTITVNNGKTITITDNKEDANKGKITRTNGDLITNNGTVIVNGAILESEDVTINGGNINIGNGKVKGGTNAIKNSGENNTIIIGNSENESIDGTPIIEATNGFGIEIASDTTQLNFYSGKIIGTDTYDVNGVEVAFKVQDETKVNYKEGYGAHTQKIGDTYETTLVKPNWDTNTKTIYLNIDDNDKAEIVVTGTDIGKITYTSEDETVVKVKEDDEDNRKATITAVGDGEVKIIVKDENSNTIKEITVIVDTTRPTIVANTESMQNARSVTMSLTVEDKGGSGLAKNNSYQYAISESNTVNPSDGWTDYTSGTPFTFGENETKTYYVWVKEIKDNSTNVSMEKGNKKDKYHIFGPYVLDNAKPSVTFNPNGNTTYKKSQSTEVTVTDIGTAGVDENSLKYQWTQNTTEPLENTFTSTFTNGGTITKDAVTGYDWYLWILAKDKLGNTEITKSNPFYIDNTPPQYSQPVIENIKTTGYDVIIPEVKDDNAGIETVKVKVWTTKDGEDEILEEDAVLQPDGKTWKYHVDETKHKNEYGEYNTVITIIDKIGNKTVVTLDKTNVPGIKLTFDSNGGNQTSPAEITRGYNSKIGTLPTTSRKGYTFAGWWTNKQNGEEISETTPTPENDTTYYAHWTAHTYTIVFNKNSDLATETMPNLAMSYDQEKELTENAFKRLGYSFKEWNTKTDGTGDKYSNKEKVKNLTDIDNGEVILYAQWTANNYKVHFNSNTGTGSIDDESFTYDQQKELNPNTFTKTGYTFAGWNTKADGTGNSYADKEKVSNLTNEVNGEITLYAQWIANKYKIHFNSNTGTGTMPDEIATYDQEKTLPTNTFTKTGYELEKWNTKADGTGDSYSDKGKVKNLTSEVNGEVTLYVQWKAKSYQVTLNAGNGIINEENGWTRKDENKVATKDITYDGTYGTLPIAAQVGYEFKGWYTEQIGGKQITAGTIMNTPNSQTLYAQWEARKDTPYTVKHYKQNTDGTYPNTPTDTEHLKGTTDEEVIPERKSYTGFNSPEGQKIIIKGDGTAELEYRYTRKSHTVTYNYLENGGESATKVTDTKKYEEIIDLSPTAIIKKSGYNFVGWNSNKDAHEKLTTLQMGDEDVTLYAIFKKDIKITTYQYENAKNEQTASLYNKETTVDVKLPTIANRTVNEIEYTQRGWSENNTANAEIAVKSGETVKLNTDKTYYASYLKERTATFYYAPLQKSDATYNNITPASKTAKAIRYMNYMGTLVNSNYQIPEEVISSTGGVSAENYIGVAKDKNSSTVVTPTTDNAEFYAVYTEQLKMYYSTGTEATSKDLVRRMLYDGTKYNNSLSEEINPTTHDNANFVAWTQKVDDYTEANRVIPLETGVDTIYAIYQKQVSITYNANTGGGAPSPTTGNKTYIAKKEGFNIYNPTVKVSTVEPTKALSVFKGWYAETDAVTKLAMPGENYELTKDTTFYAGWDEANCSVTNSKGTFYYLTLKDAVANADSTGSIILIIRNYTETPTVTIDKSVTINTNGKTVTMTNNITISENKTVTFSGNGKIQRTSGGLINNNGTIILNGATLESKDNVIKDGTVTVTAGIVNSTGKASLDSYAAINANKITVSGGTISGTLYGIMSNGANSNITITGGTVTGGTDGIYVEAENTTVTIGDTSKAPTTPTPVITGTNALGINIASTTSNLNFYSGTIKGKTHSTTRGVNTAYSVADQSKVNYPGGLGSNGYGAKTTIQGGMYVTTLDMVTLSISPAEIYLNLNNNTTSEISVNGNNYGMLQYTSDNDIVARVSNTGKIEARTAGETIIKVTEVNSGKTATCKVIVDTVLPKWTVTIKEIN